MADLSVGARLAWQITAVIAGERRHQHIEPEHMFAGVFGLGELLAQRGEAALDDQLRPGVEAEIRPISDALAEHGVDPVKGRPWRATQGHPW